MSHISDTAMSHPMSTESGFRPDSQLSDATAAPTIPLDSSPPQQQLAASLSAPPPEDPFVAQVDNSMAIHASGPFSPPTAALSPPPPAAGGLTVPSSPAAAESPADQQLITFSPGTPMVSAGVIGAPVPVLAAPPDDQPPEPVVAAPDLHPPPPPGPPDLVDHRPNTSQPELVSDVSVSAETGQRLERSGNYNDTNHSFIKNWSLSRKAIPVVSKYIHSSISFCFKTPLRYFASVSNQYL